MGIRKDSSRPATPALDQVKDDFFFDLRIREVQAEIVNCTHVSKIKKDFWIDREEQGVLADLSKTQFFLRPLYFTWNPK